MKVQDWKYIFGLMADSCLKHYKHWLADQDEIIKKPWWKNKTGHAGFQDQQGYSKTYVFQNVKHYGVHLHFSKQKYEFSSD